MNIPGFTAEAALNRATTNYRRLAGAANSLPSARALAPALKKNAEPGYIDCKDYPYGSFCKECGATGPDSAVCCPNNYCIINNPPDERGTKGGGLRATHGTFGGGFLRL